MAVDGVASVHDSAPDWSGHLAMREGMRMWFIWENRKSGADFDIPARPALREGRFGVPFPK